MRRCPGGDAACGSGAASRSRLVTVNDSSVELMEIPAAEYEFRFLSGRLCLDLSATVGERWRRNFERLRTPADLRRWMRESSLVAVAPPTDEADLERFRRLREAVYRSARAAMAGEAPARADERVLTASAAGPPLRPVLANGAVSWRAGDGAGAVLSTVARDAIDLLGGPMSTRIRECASDDCALLFVDASRPGQRRWCSGAACGGRVRSAAYRSRQRG
jgi:predicted RNA-binding Zn ribbon-like protein